MHISAGLSKWILKDLCPLLRGTEPTVAIMPNVIASFNLQNEHPVILM